MPGAAHQDLQEEHCSCLLQQLPAWCLGIRQKMCLTQFTQPCCALSQLYNVSQKGLYFRTGADMTFLGPNCRLSHQDISENTYIWTQRLCLCMAFDIRREGSVNVN